MNEIGAADKASETMNVLRYVATCVASVVAGSLTGGIGGLLLGWFLGFGYHKQGRSDPADAPVYVAMGLALIGVCTGAIAGLIIAAIYSLRQSRRMTRTR